MFDPDYEVFFAIAEAGSVSGAAKARGASTASFSKRLARLEARLGTKLIHRTTRSMELTASGHLLFHEVESLRAAIEEVEIRLGGRSGVPSGPVRLTAPTSFGRLHLAAVLAEYCELYPKIELEIELSDTYVDLRASRFDLAVRISARPDPGLRTVRLARNQRVLCAAPAYCERFGSPRSVADLASHRLLAADGQFPWLLEGPGGAVAVEGISSIRTNSSEIVRELALNAQGIALRSLWDVVTHLRNGELVRVLPEWEGSVDAWISVLHAPIGTPRPAATALVELLRERLSKSEQWTIEQAAEPARH